MFNYISLSSAMAPRSSLHWADGYQIIWFTSNVNSACFLAEPEMEDKHQSKEVADRSDLISDDGKNCKSIVCQRCRSKVLCPGMASLAEKEVNGQRQVNALNSAMQCHAPLFDSHYFNILIGSTFAWNTSNWKSLKLEKDYTSGIYFHIIGLFISGVSKWVPRINGTDLCQIKS